MAGVGGFGDRDDEFSRLRREREFDPEALRTSIADLPKKLRGLEGGASGGVGAAGKARLGKVDIDSFITHTQDMIVIDAVRQAKTICEENEEEWLIEGLTNNWDSRRRRMMAAGPFSSSSSTHSNFSTGALEGGTNMSSTQIVPVASYISLKHGGGGGDDASYDYDDGEGEAAMDEEEEEEDEEEK